MIRPGRPRQGRLRRRRAGAARPLTCPPARRTRQLSGTGADSGMPGPRRPRPHQPHIELLRSPTDAGKAELSAFSRTPCWLVCWRPWVPRRGSCRGCIQRRHRYITRGRRAICGRCGVPSIAVAHNMQAHRPSSSAIRDPRGNSACPFFMALLLSITVRMPSKLADLSVDDIAPPPSG
jgi:hypothetical protein